ncbi:MAG: hypothetical protein K0R51_390 [Cytophagaceae bacterium]|nr:hypothetical protein [Cytophagaceae bacterium]
MRKQAELLFRHPLTQWIKKTPHEVLIIGALVMLYLIQNIFVLLQMLFEIY